MSKFLVQHNKKITVLLLTLIFVVPMMTAWLSFSRGWFLSDNKTNHGILLGSPLPIAELGLTEANERRIDSKLTGKWWLMYLTENIKDNFSKRNLYYIRQIRQATGKDRERIERAIITVANTEQDDVWLQKVFPGTHHFIISNTKLQGLESNLPKKLALRKGSLYLVDPLGNIMLFYAPDAAPKGILKDLQKVLKVSQIG